MRSVIFSTSTARAAAGASFNNTSSSSKKTMKKCISPRRHQHPHQKRGLKTSAFFDELKQKASQVLETSAEEEDEEGLEKENDEGEYPEESTDYDDENANPFKTMLQKGMKKPAFISRDEDEEYVNYDNTVDEMMEEEMRTNNGKFSSAAENLIPKFSVPKFNMPEKKASPPTPAYKEEKEEEETKTANPFAKMLNKSKSVQMTKDAQGERDFDSAMKERVSSKAAAALMEAKDTDTAKWTLTPDSSTSKKRLSKINLKNGDVLIVGRQRGNGVDVSVPLPCVSGVHCQLEMERNKLYVTDLGSTNGTYVDGFQLRKNNRFRVFDQSVVRLGAENTGDEDYASFGSDLTGADEMEKNSEYGQLNYFIEFLGGPKVVINFIFINLVFQGTFFLLLKYL